MSQTSPSPNPPASPRKLGLKGNPSLGRLSSPRLIALTFFSVIVIGTLALKMPGIVTEGASVPFLDALFTATSAVCVTGLSTITVINDLTFAGQVVLLALIQIGGLGIMTLSAALLVLLRQRLDRSSHRLVADTFSGGVTCHIQSLLKQITLIVIVAETIGAILLYFTLPADAVAPIAGDSTGIGPRIWTAVFHSVSAFCNAGFSLYPDSLMSWGDDYIPLSIIMLLIVIGGIGFFVLGDVRRLVTGRGRVLALQTKLVLAVTAILIVGGMAGIWLAERDRTLSEMPFFKSWFHALFQSISARTAGFNTVPLEASSHFGLFIIICLMLVGGSPGSTAGGMKTTTFGIAIMTLVSHLRGREDVEIFRRRVALETVQRSFLIIMAMLLLIAVSFTALRGGHDYSDYRPSGEKTEHVLLPLGFETVSAACTVGLSADFTGRLTSLGKLIVILLMFAGRLGPLTLALALVQSGPKANYRLPEEPVMVG